MRSLHDDPEFAKDRDDRFHKYKTDPAYQAKRIAGIRAWHAARKLAKKQEEFLV